MGREKLKRKIRWVTAGAAALLLAAAFTFPAEAGLSDFGFGNAIVASAYYVEGNFLYDENDDGTVKIIGYNGSDTDVVIPGTISGKTVISIDARAFFGNNVIKSITIPESVTNIGKSAFESCSSLESVTFGENSQLETIGEQAFYACISLTSITIPDSIVSIGGFAFIHCSSLESVTFGDNSKLETIAYYAFSNCSSLTSITIPNSVTSVGEFAFDDCTSLTSIFLPTTADIGSYAVPDEAIQIKYTVGEDGNVTIITGWSSGTGQISVDIPQNICGKTVTAIGDSAFNWCRSLTSITIPDSVTSIGGGAFSNCTSLTSITIPDRVTSIGDGAFSSCTSLTNITIPDSVTSIGDGAFSSCTSLTGVTVDESNPNYSSEGGVLFDKNKTTLIIYPVMKEGTSYVIPNSVTSIRGYAFEKCEKLENVTFEGNSKITAIGEDAFADCTSLKSITIPDSVTSIGYGAFVQCTSLESITIPEGVTAIEGYTFYNCTSLESITIPEGVNVIGEYAFRECTSLKSITIPGSVTSIETYAFLYCGNLESVTFGENSKLETIADSTFNCCSSLTSITIPDGVTTIGNDAFYMCESLESITIPTGVNSIGERAFYMCESLESITIPTGVNSIGERAFYMCNSLESITIPGSVTSIGTYAFYCCRNLESITILTGVNSIGAYAFSYCTSLTSVFLPTTATVGYNAVPEKAAKLIYTVADGKVTITEITLGTGQTSAPIPPYIDGHQVVAVAESYHDKVGAHTCVFGTATCTAKAKCGLCGIESGEMSEHSFTNYVYNNDATCTENGTETTACDNCDATDTREAEDSALGHAYGAPVFNWAEDNSCKAVFTCERDDTHVEESDCEVSITASTDAVCETGGSVTYTAKVTFENTEYSDEKTVDVPAIGHTIVKVEKTEPTCTEDGYEAHFKCSVCGKRYSDGQAAEQVPLESLIIAAHHVYGTKWESDNDDHYHICTVCGDKTDITAHTYGKWKITVPATAEANGKKERVCEICGYVEEGTVIYGGDETTGDIDNATKPEENTCHADIELTDEDIISKIPLTPEELEAIENGADLEVYMVVIDYSGNVSSADKALAEAVLTGDMQIGMYIDVSLFVKVGDNEPRAVTETNGNLKITFEMPEKLINTDKNVTREYSIIRVHEGNVTVLDCAYDSATRKGLFSTDRFSTYAIAYNDIAAEEPAPEPIPVVRYPIAVKGNVTVDKATATAGENVNVRTDLGYDIIVTAENGQRIAKITEKGSFTMPASKVYVTAVQNETYALMATAWRQSYVYSYDSDMNQIKINSTQKRGVIIVNLGEDYAGKSFTIYSGRKNSDVKITEGVLNSNGAYKFEVPDGKNYTLVVED